MQHYFITGTSRGIGKSLTERILQQPNTQVHGFSRHQEVEHERYHHRKADLAGMDWLLKNIDGFFPNLPSAERIVLINNAGMLGEVKYVGELENQQFVDLFNLNITAPAMLMNQFIKTYRNQPGKKLIINVSSGAGKYPVDGWSGYCASKAALDMLSQVTKAELTKRNLSKGFKVYALAPGVVDTAMQGEIREVSQDNFSNIEKFINYKKEGTLDDASFTAEKFMELINNTERFEEVLQDVRQY
ncbi:benzil reductase ((S)-benzoin forming) [Catalinimonas alkaloidigena]|uniref:SDR family NAD(P)-dependent oxidoreductase n=1 Tax=Catalinimonas alkaloidigena TaxID=1075417 RepID=UPI002405F15F|nr:SDR family NAD(P)-dependent oxidoreductase [Catalinimonas alkaloidigena]MDF9795910.1 benzil reductase ((S)-benzoin forming) [Catalinimonas alkaloidigena]